MKIKILPGKTSGPIRVFKLGTEDKEVIGREFDNLQAPGKLEYSTEATPYAFPVFVVWSTVYMHGNPMRKARVIVDIRGLNKITEFDAYPMPVPSDNISYI